MNIVNKLKTLCKISLVSIALILLLVSFTALAGTAESVSPTITETRIATNESWQEFLAICGDRIIWQDYCNQ
jgi:hypothetical protein